MEIDMTDGERIEAEAEARQRVLEQIRAERRRQDLKWGGSQHDDEHSTAAFVQLIEDYAGWARTMAGMGTHDKARNRLVQVAALAVAAVEAIDRASSRILPRP